MKAYIVIQWEENRPGFTESICLTKGRAEEIRKKLLRGFRKEEIKKIMESEKVSRTTAARRVNARSVHRVEVNEAEVDTKGADIVEFGEGFIVVLRGVTHE